jgi:hypothetical protein
MLRWLFIVVLAAALAVQGHGIARGQGVVIFAKKVVGDIPLDPHAPLWEGAPLVEIPLFPQVMAKPRIYESSIRGLEVRALHNGREIAFLLQWRDETQDAGVDVGGYGDAAALEFPSQGAEGKPHFGMGDGENPANIWYWRAASEEAPGAMAPKQYSPRFETDPQTHILIDRAWQSGVLAGNPISHPLAPPVENLVSVGFSTLTDNSASQVLPQGRASWKDGRWRLLLKRALESTNRYDVSFTEGAVTPVAFAVWDGSQGNRGARKAVSTWYYVALQTEERMAAYVLPVVAFLGVAALEYWVINLIRKKRAG